MEKWCTHAYSSQAIPSAHQRQAMSQEHWVVHMKSSLQDSVNRISKDAEHNKDSIWNLSALLRPGATSELEFPRAALHCCQAPSAPWKLALTAARTFRAIPREAPVPVA